MARRNELSRIAALPALLCAAPALGPPLRRLRSPDPDLLRALPPGRLLRPRAPEAGTGRSTSTCAAPGGRMEPGPEPECRWPRRPPNSTCGSPCAGRTTGPAGVSGRCNSRPMPRRPGRSPWCWPRSRAGPGTTTSPTTGPTCWPRRVSSPSSRRPGAGRCGEWCSWTRIVSRPDREHLETHFRNAGLGVEVVVFENFGQHYAITGQVQGESVAVTADDGTHKHTRNLEFER